MRANRILVWLITVAVMIGSYLYATNGTTDPESIWWLHVTAEFLILPFLAFFILGYMTCWMVQKKE